MNLSIQMRVEKHSPKEAAWVTVQIRFQIARKKTRAKTKVSLL